MTKERNETQRHRVHRDEHVIESNGRDRSVVDLSCSPRVDAFGLAAYRSKLSNRIVFPFLASVSVQAKYATAATILIFLGKG